MATAYDLLLHHAHLRAMRISLQPATSTLTKDLQRAVEYGIDHADQPAWWADDITAALEAAAPGVPDDWELHEDALPQEQGLWWFPRGVRIFDDPSLPPAQFIAWARSLNASLNNQPSYVFGVFAAAGDTTIVDCMCWNVDTPVVDPEDNQDPRPEKQVPETRLPFRFIAAATSFLAQRLAAPARVRLGRPERRWLGDRPEPALSVIHFRKREYGSAHGQADVAWACRWIVSAHWQRYHTGKGVRSRFVLPYLKGPDDKPVRLRGKVGAIVR